jgi:deoxyribodipyrimidine photo-lyase
MSRALVWFRRDLRDFDHAALAAALAAHAEVHCAFVFDREILDPLPREDARVAFIHACVQELDDALRRRGGGLHAIHGLAREEIPRLARALAVEAVFVNRDYEPQAVARDEAVGESLRASGIALRGFKDQVVFEVDEVLTRAGQPFSVFTPYRNAWLAKLAPHHVAARAVDPEPGQLARAHEIPSLAALGFAHVATAIEPGMAAARKAWEAFRERIGDYAQARDYPAREGTSGLSAHLRFGTLPIRELVRFARARRSAGASAWLSELAWRDFYFALLSVRPDATAHAYLPAYDRLSWEEDEEGWNAWREGRTGYPIVDAAMRELAARGTMHNRLRMVTASFLVKDLGLDWRRGERWFAERLLDYDQAANVGNWQWCASTGTDSQPWFRVFNPVTQSKRFDPEAHYIRRWLPELARVPPRRLHAPWEMSEAEQRTAGCMIGRDYPSPVVDHACARERTLARYAAVRA